MRISFRISLLVIAVTFAVLTATAQDTKWVRYSSDDGKLSALLPPGALIDTKKGELGEVFRIYGFVPTVDITLTARKRPSLLFILPEPGQKDQPKPSEKEDFIVSKSEETSGGRYRCSIRVLDKKFLYDLSVEGPSANNPAVVRALSGLRIDGKPFSSKAQQETEVSATVFFSKLVASPEVEEARKRKLVNLKGQVTYEAATTGEVETPGPKYSRRAFIVERPAPMSNPGLFPLSGAGGSVLRSIDSYAATIRVTLRADGQVGDIVIIGAPQGDFTKRVQQAVRKIRFVPAQIDGQNADSAEVLQYGMIDATYR